MMNDSYLQSQLKCMCLYVDMNSDTYVMNTLIDFAVIGIHSNWNADINNHAVYHKYG